MLVNQISPINIKERICIHGSSNNRGEPTTYLIAEAGQGKSTETIRQAVFRRDTILSTEDDFYRTAGMKHVSDARETEVSYIGLSDVFDKKFYIDRDTLYLCVDNAKAILEELLTQRFGIPVIIDFMSLEA